MKTWKFRIGIVLVFLVGAAIGSLCTGWWFLHWAGDFRPPRARVEAHVMQRLARDLDLSDAQRADMAAIVHDVISQLEVVREHAEPEVKRAMEEGMARAKSKLTPEQFAKLEHRYQEMRQRWERRREKE